jgi:hypothetical protein
MASFVAFVAFVASWSAGMWRTSGWNRLREWLKRVARKKKMRAKLLELKNEMPRWHLGRPLTAGRRSMP